jgi:Protein of unknown function (DUF2894)
VKPEAPAALHGTASAAVRQHHLAALARRAALQQGRVRQLLDERLRVLQVAADAASAPSPEPVPVPEPVAPGSALAALLAHIARQGAAPEPSATPPGPPLQAPPPRELKALRDYRSTWSRLAMEQRLHQALARVPHNAGPLNTQRLVHQVLTALRDASPAYLLRLVAQVEALLWLEALGPGAPGGAAGKKHGAGRPGPGRPAAAATGSGRS